jgi:hypothetical protein
MSNPSNIIMSSDPELCQTCHSPFLLFIISQHRDMFQVETENSNEISHTGYGLNIPPISCYQSDVCEFRLCGNCGQVQGQFPLDKNTFFQDGDEESDGDEEEPISPKNEEKDDEETKEA